MSFFAFPLNLILALLWSALVFMTFRHASTSKVVRFILSPLSTVISISLFILACLIIGLTGNRDWILSIPFITIYLYFMTVLYFVVLRGWIRDGKVRWRFLLNHLGLLIALASAFWGTPDSETMKIQAFKDIPVREAYRMDGSRAWLPYEIELKDMNAEFYEDGTPSSFTALLRIGEDTEVLKVNHPYSRSLAEDIYLSGYDTEQEKYCIVQIVKEPWKYPALAGIFMMLAGAMLLFLNGPSKNQKS